jgi:hypothetical protein
MKEALGKDIAIEPLLHATDEALESLVGNKSSR